MFHRFLATLMGTASLLSPAALHAQDDPVGAIDSVTVGALAHEVANDAEGGIDGALELRFRPLFGRDWAIEVLPTVGGTVNFSGDTNTAYAGATARYHLTDSFYVEGFFGLVVHDADTPRDSGGLDLGCTVLFREGAAIGYRNGHHALALSVSHASHGDILCDGPNDGMTNVGVYYGYHF